MHNILIMKPKQALCLFMFAFMCACNFKKNSSALKVSVNYPSPLPKEQVISFMPNIVSGKGLDFNSAFSRDGNTFYFSRSKNRKYFVYETRFDGKNWTRPERSKLFDTLYSNTDPFITKDGSIYYISNRPKDEADTISDYDIYKLPKTANGYESPINLTQVNSDSTEYYVSLAENGTIYFASYRDGNLDLYNSKMTSLGYEYPKKIDSLNSDAGEHDPFIAPDESFIIFTSTRAGGLGEADLYISNQINGAWQKPVNMGNQINTSSYDYCPYITPDGMYFFIPVKWTLSGLAQMFYGH
jgi:Tol biopolymer transport system component